MLTVWGRRSSFNVQKVMWLIGELGLDHRHIDAGGRFGGLDAPEFMAMNPHGRIPVIGRRFHGLGIACDPSLSGRALWRRAFLVGKRGGPRARRRLDGLVANVLATGFPGRRILGLLSNAG